jgi:hypothetical protein
VPPYARSGARRAGRSARSSALPLGGRGRNRLDADHARRARAGALRSRPRDHGRRSPARRRRCARNPRARGREAVRRARADPAGGNCGRALPPLAPHGGVRQASGAAARLLRARADRRARLAAHLGRPGADGVPARGLGRGRRQRAADRAHGGRADRALAHARSRLAGRAAAADGVELGLPPQRGTGLPRHPRPRRGDADGAAGRAVGRARRPGLSARAEDARGLRAAQAVRRSVPGGARRT